MSNQKLSTKETLIQIAKFVAFSMGAGIVQTVTFTLPMHAYKYTIGNNKTPAELKVGDIVIFDESNYYGITNIGKFPDGTANITIQTTIDHPEENIFNADLIEIEKIKQEIVNKHDNYSPAKIESKVVFPLPLGPIIL